MPQMNVSNYTAKGLPFEIYIRKTSSRIMNIWRRKNKDWSEGQATMVEKYKWERGAAKSMHSLCSELCPPPDRGDCGSKCAFHQEERNEERRWDKDVHVPTVCAQGEAEGLKEKGEKGAGFVWRSRQHWSGEPPFAFFPVFPGEKCHSSPLQTTLVSLALL